jgi:hypothetical protein
MRPWVPLTLTLTLALVLVALPAAAQPAFDGSKTTTSVRTDSPVEVPAGGVAAAPVEVAYSYTPLPALQPTPTHLSVKDAPSGLELAFNPATVYHPTDDVEPYPETTRTSVAEAEVNVAAAEELEGAYKIVLEGISRANGPHASSQGTTHLLVEVVPLEASATTSSQASTSQAAVAPGAGAPVGALASLVAAGALAVGVVRAAHSD